MRIFEWPKNENNPSSLYRQQNLLAAVVLCMACLFLIAAILINRRTPPPAPRVVAGSVASQKLATPQPEKAQDTTITAKLLFMGDTMLARSIGQNIIHGSNPYQFVQSTLDSYDFRMANLETTIAEPQTAVQASGKLYTFNAPVGAIQALSGAHIDAVSLANNHTHDFGSAALDNMLTNLKSANIKTAGAGRTVNEAFSPLIVDIPTAVENNSAHTADHVRLAVIAVNDIENSYTNVTDATAGSAYFDKQRIAAAIATAHQTDKADIIVVLPHWGVEYQTSPTGRQISWGHFFLDSGADIVIGSHPHVVQTTENYRGKYIIYSMGNFIFDGMSGSALDGEMIGLTVTIHEKTSPDGSTVGTRSVNLAPPQTIGTHLDDRGYPELH